MREALLNGAGAMIGTFAGFCAAEVLAEFLPWEWLAAVSGGILSLVLVCLIMAVRQKKKVIGIYSRAVSRMAEEEK